MFYALHDLQTGGLLYSGRNSKTLSELKDAFLSYISIDFEDEKDARRHKRLSLRILTVMWEFEILKSKEAFPDEYE